MSRRDDWAVLFLLSPSPGKVFRFLERHYPNAPAAALPDLLSDPAPPHGWRALTGLGISPARMEEIGHSLSRVFPPRVTLLWRGPDTSWGYVVWEAETEIERGGSSEESGKRRPLLSRISGILPAAPPPSIAWAKARGLPVSRVPGAASPGSREAAPVIEYAAVATLDQRSLLVENAPRLYRFSYTP